MAVVADDNLAAIETAFLVFSQASSTLFYNQNGKRTGFGSGSGFVILDGVTSVDANDFVIEV